MIASWEENYSLLYYSCKFSKCVAKLNFIKDAGRKCFGVNLIADERIAKDILERLNLESE